MKKHVAIGLPFGLLFGPLLGKMAGNIALGFIFGPLLGVLIGLVITNGKHHGERQSSVQKNESLEIQDESQV